jgi:hypothetical protein
MPGRFIHRIAASHRQQPAIFTNILDRHAL